MHTSVRYGILLAAGLALALLVPQLQSQSRNAAMLARLQTLLVAIKSEARANLSGRPDPATLQPYARVTPWGATVLPTLYPRGTYAAERTIGLRLGDLPSRVCADLLQQLAQEQRQGLWQRLQVNEMAIGNLPDWAERQRLCADAKSVSVYFRI